MTFFSYADMINVPKVRHFAPMQNNVRDHALRRYLATMNSIPPLSAERERELVIAWQQHGDTRARERLARAHLRLVASLANKFAGYRFDPDDVISEGTLGLMRAIDSYDLDHGTRLSTYAMWWIRASLYEYVEKNFSLVKFVTTADDKKLLFRLRRVKAEMGITNSRLTDSQIDEIATVTNTKTASVIKMNARLTGRDSSLNSPVGDDQSKDWIDLLESDDPTPYDIVALEQLHKLRSTAVERAMSGLKPRERHILTARRLSDPHQTLEELGQHYGLTRERIRQIEVVAMKRVTKAIAADINAGKFLLAA